jgi:hypothetical protein
MARTSRPFDGFWLRWTLAITQRDEQRGDMLAVAGWATPRLTRALGDNHTLVIERRAYFDRLIATDQHTTGCRSRIRVQIAHSVATCVNASPQESVASY